MAPFLPFVLAVIVAAWNGGLESGLLATVLSALAALYLFTPPYYTLRIENPGELAGLVVFAVLGVTASGLCEALHAARRRSDGQRLQVEREVRERQRAEAALWEHRERLRVTLASIGDAVIATDTDGRVTYLNAVAESLTGWSLPEAEGQPMAKVFHIVNETTRKLVDNPVDRVLREGVVVGLANHTILIARDGTERPIDDSAAPIRDDHGRMLGAVLVFHDITERRRAEKLLQESEERLRMGLDAARMITFDWNRKTGHVVHSANHVHLVGAKVEHDSVGWGLTHPDDVEPLKAAIADAVARRGRYVRQNRVIRPDTGEVRWFEVWGNVVEDESGEPNRVVGVGVDITERKQAEELARRHNEHVQLLLEAATTLLEADDPDAMLRRLFDKIGPQLGVDAYLNFLIDPTGPGLRLASCVGIPDETARTICRLEFGQSVCGTVAFQRKPMVATNVQSSDDPKVQLVKSMGIRAYACNPLLAENHLIGTLSFARRTRDTFDPEELAFLQTLSRYVSVAYERLRLVDRLRDADRRKDEFLATLAHELRNPLAPVRTALHLLRQTHRNGNGHAAESTHANGELAEQAQRIMERQVGQLVRLVDDLLDVARITQGKLQLRRERVDLAAVVQTAVEASRPLIEEMGHELTVSLPSQRLTLDADPVRVTQVILNLLNNAAKYTEKGGQVCLTAEREGSDVVLRIRDNGIGIAPEKLPHVFEMFAQVEGPVGRSQGGLGLGLTLVRRLTEMHGGSVDAVSEGLGKGAEFIVRLPLALGLHNEEVPQTSEEAAAVGPRRRILVVDDNRDGADSLSLMLELLGNKLQTAYDGIEAVTAAENFRPDVILLDIGLPKLNGHEVCRRIRQAAWGKRIVLIAVTGWGQEEDKRLAQDTGFNFHLVKPVNPTDLEKLLAGLLPVPV